MKIKKLLKHLPIKIMTVSIILASIAFPLSLLNNSPTQNTFNYDQQVDDTDFSDQTEFIRNDVEKQTGVNDSIASIELVESSSANDHSAALVTKTDGSTLLYMWGRNDYGQLGNGTYDSTPNPTKVTIPNSTSPIVKTALGTFHSAALLENGSLYMWGRNSEQQCDLGGGAIPGEISKIYYSRSPIKEIALGFQHSAILLENGELYTWGNNNDGQLGRDSATDTTNVKINSASKIIKMAVARNHSAALLEDGTMYMWGSNMYGQLGSPLGYNTQTPTKVTGLNSKKITQIALGSFHSAALLDDGSLYMWGNNKDGQLGSEINQGTPKPNYTPIKVPINSALPIIQIALGQNHSAALFEGGKMYMWGYNFYGQLGIGGFAGINSASPIIRMVLGGDHTSAITSDGSIYMWGNNYHGQLGNAKNVGIPSIANPNPTWIYQIGKDSKITGKPTITAKTAFDNIWVDNKFNISGFRSSFNLTGIPDVTDQSFVVDAKPTYDDFSGTLTMNIKIKYFYDKEGFIVADTSRFPMIIMGFKSIGYKTNITTKTTLVNSVVVDKWLTYVNVDGKINRAKLEEFLTLLFVPTDAEFIITDLIPHNKTGLLTFNINTNKIIDNNDKVQNAVSGSFLITLNLTPRITEMTPITTGYPSDLTAAALKAKLFESNGLVRNLTELQKYVNIIAPVDGAKYYLIMNSWVSHGDDGTVEFSIYVDKYYNTDGNEKTGDSSVTDSQVKISLTLQREKSIIAVKKVMPNVRVDRFEAYVKNNGKTVVRSKLEEFFDLTNVPSDAEFTLGTPTYSAYDENFTRNQITFNLAIDKFNQYIPTVPLAYNENFTLTLTRQYMPTKIVTNSTGGDQNIPLGYVEKQLKSLVGIDLVAFLERWVTIESLPLGTTITVKNVSGNYNTGFLTFDVEPSQIYDSYSDIMNPSRRAYHISLTFNPDDTKTIFRIDPDYSKIRIDRFVDSITTLEYQELYDFLESDYVLFSNVDPTKLSVQVISQDFKVGKIRIKVSVSQYYDENSNLIQDVKSETFDYVLTPKYTSTAISVLPTSVYPRDLTPDQFKQRLKTDGAAVSGNVYTLSSTNITFLNKFLRIVSVPPSAAYTLTFIPGTYVVANKLSFNLAVSSYYAGGDLVMSSRAFNNLTLSLSAVDMPTKLATVITTKQDAGIVNTTDEFLNMIKNADGSYNLEILANFVVGLNTMPLEGDVITITKDSVDNDGTAHFILRISYYYDGINNDPQPDGEYKFTVKTLAQVVTEDQFPWWWILVGVGGAAVAGLGVWFFLKKRNGGYGNRRHTTKRRY